MVYLKIVSFNIWDNKFLKTERLEWFYKHIIKNRPDIILFQKVTKENAIFLSKKLLKYKYNYKISSECRNSFELIAARWPIQSFKFNRYSTSQESNGILWAVITVNDQEIVIASSKLDQASTAKKYGQLDCALKSLANRSKNCIFGCDTSLQLDEKYTIFNNWNDAWEATGKNELYSTTYDIKNKNVTEDSCTRQDRIYYRGAFKNAMFELIGTEPSCPFGKEMVQPSTHFGLLLRLEF